MPAKTDGHAPATTKSGAPAAPVAVSATCGRSPAAIAARSGCSHVYCDGRLGLGVAAIAASVASALLAATCRDACATNERASPLGSVATRASTASASTTVIRRLPRPPAAAGGGDASDGRRRLRRRRRRRRRRRVEQPRKGRLQQEHHERRRRGHREERARRRRPARRERRADRRARRGGERTRRRRVAGGLTAGEQHGGGRDDRRRRAEHCVDDEAVGRRRAVGRRVGRRVPLSLGGGILSNCWSSDGLRSIWTLRCGFAFGEMHLARAPPINCSRTVACTVPRRCEFPRAALRVSHDAARAARVSRVAGLRNRYW